MDGDQAIRNRLGQLLERIGKIRFEVDIVALLELGIIDTLLAHQVQNHFPAQLVILGQCITALNRQHVRIDPRIVL